MPPPQPNRIASIQRLLGYAALVAFVLAMVLVVFVSKFQFLSATSALTQAEIARNVAEGRGLTTDVLRPLGVGLAGDQAGRVLFSAPLYPLALSLPMRLLGAQDNVVALTSTVLNLLTLTLVALVSIRCFGEKVAVGSVIILLFTVPFIEQGVTGDESAFLALIVTGLFSILLLWQHADRPRSQWWTVGAAVLAGMAWLTRHEMLVLVPALVVFWLVADRRRFWRRLLWTVIPVVALAAPWIARNVMLLQRPVVSAESYMLLSDTTAYQGDSIARRATPEPEHPWVVAARHPGMMYLKVRERLRPLYSRIAMLGNPFITAFFLVGAVIATVRGRFPLIYWTVLLALALTGFALTMYTDHVAVLICFVPAVTMLAVFAFVEIVSDLDRPSAGKSSRPGALLGRRVRNWIGLDGPGRGTGRVVSFALVLLALVATYPMADYLFVRPPARPNPIVRATERLGDDPYSVIMTDVPFAVTWYANKRTLLVPEGVRQLEAMEEMGLRVDAVYMRVRPGLARDMFPGFEWVERPDLPALLWERVDDDLNSDGPGE